MFLRLSSTIPDAYNLGNYAADEFPASPDAVAMRAERNASGILARSGIKGYLGENSTEYEQAGGTRTAERKRPERKAKAPETLK